MHKKLLALLLALLIAFSVVSITASAEDDDDYPEDDYTEVIGDFTFRVNDEYPLEAYLIDYSGSSTSVVVPSTVNGYTVTRIWSTAFNNNASRKKITSITLPDNLEEISNGVFSSIPNVKTIKVPTSVKYFEFNLNDLKSTAWYKNRANGVVYLGTMAIGCKGTVPSSLTLKAGTTAVAEKAFYGKTAIKKIGFPSGLLKIDYCAFAGCINLKDVVVPKSVNYIGAGALGYKKYEWVEVSNTDAEDDEDVLEAVLLSGFTLYGAKDSQAQTYATENGIKFEYTVAKPGIIKFQNVNGGTTVYWDKVPNGKYYRLFGKSSKGWETICSKTSKTSYTYKYKDKTSGKYHYFTVRAISANGKVYTSTYNKDGWKYMYIAPPANPTLSNAKNGVKVAWKKPKGAAYFRVFRKTGSSGWKKVCDTNKLAAVDKTAKKGVTYTYTIRVINKTGTKYLSAFKAGSKIKRK